MNCITVSDWVILSLFHRLYSMVSLTLRALMLRNTNIMRWVQTDSIITHSNTSTVYERRGALYVLTVWHHPLSDVDIKVFGLDSTADLILTWTVHALNKQIFKLNDQNWSNKISRSLHTVRSLSVLYYCKTGWLLLTLYCCFYVESHHIWCEICWISNHPNVAHLICFFSLLSV